MRTVRLKAWPIAMPLVGAGLTWVAKVARRKGARVGFDIVAPDPAGTVESLSALGYSLESAVADLIDNSIDAGASTVDVLFHWAGAESYVAIVDDGRGMPAFKIREAMALAARGPSVERGNKELGRFGMGLKTASFSQASRLVVWSRAADEEAEVRIWDLDNVVATGEWQLLNSPDEHEEGLFKEITQRVPRTGTIVLWKKLTKLVDDSQATEDEDAHNHFLAAMARVEEHLSMVFGKFLAGGRGRQRRKRLTLRVNGAVVEPWDPFMESHEATLAQPVEHLVLNGHPIVVRPYVLPPKRSLSDEQYARGGGSRGWADQQGFYVYRNDRLIVSGDWLELVRFRKDEKHLLARIAIEMPADVDYLWSVDVKKATARPPLFLRAPLTRIGKATRLEAQRVLSAISRTAAITKSDDLSYVWRPERKDGELRLRLNWQHPLVKETLHTSPEAKATVRALLSYIEETVPLPALRLMFDNEQDRDYEPFSSAAPNEVVKVAERVYGAYVSQGLSPAQARTRLKHTPPFNEYPDLLQMLNLD